MLLLSSSCCAILGLMLSGVKQQHCDKPHSGCLDPATPNLRQTDLPEKQLAHSHPDPPNGSKTTLLYYVVRNKFPVVSYSVTHGRESLIGKQSLHVAVFCLRKPPPTGTVS